MKKITAIFKNNRFWLLAVAVSVIFSASFLVFFKFWQKNQSLSFEINQSKVQEESLKKELEKIGQELDNLKNEDQRQRNNQLSEEINNIQKTYQQGVTVYENLLSLKEKSSKTATQDKQFASALNLLAKRNYASASAILAQLNQEIELEKAKIVASLVIPTNVPVNNAPPGSGYQRQQVKVDGNSFLVDIVAADLNSTRVIVDTASEGDCFNDCPVLPLSTYISRNNAFAGVNGSYFCPAEYPNCADKKNTFDTLLMNKNKVYFNSNNNVYSTVPVAAFYGNTARFMAQSLEWGRDTGVDAVIANRPLLTHNGQLIFTAGGETKEASRGNRSFLGSSGSNIYIGVVHNATVAESAKTLHTLGIQNAINLDNGGSTALWSSGYKVGPGRNLPNAVLLIRK